VAATQGILAVASCGADGGTGGVATYLFDVVAAAWAQQQGWIRPVGTGASIRVPLVLQPVASDPGVTGARANGGKGAACGTALALHGRYLAVGCPGYAGDDGRQLRAGTVLLYVADDFGAFMYVTRPQPASTTGDAALSVTAAGAGAGAAVAVTAWPATIIAGAAGVGAATVFEATGVPTSLWDRLSQQGGTAPFAESATLRALDTAAGDRFGASVAVAGSVGAVGSPGDDAGTGSVVVTACGTAPCQLAAGAFLATRCTAGHDRTCAACSSGRCGAGSYEAAPCSATADRVCAPCSPRGSCPAGTVQVAACSAAADRVCAPTGTGPQDTGCVEAELCGFHPAAPAGGGAGPANIATGAAAPAPAAQQAVLRALYAATSGPKWSCGGGVRGDPWGGAIAAKIDPCTGTFPPLASAPQLVLGVAGVVLPGSGAAAAGDSRGLPWPGVRCDVAGNIVALRLPRCGLVGSLPTGFGLGLRGLVTLDLSANLLTGPLPASLFDAAAVPSLARIDLGGNLFTGRLPDALLRLPRLTHLGLLPSPGLLLAPGDAGPAGSVDVEAGRSEQDWTFNAALVAALRAAGVFVA
jgi:hypothetical protein